MSIRTAFSRMIDAREARARRYVNGVLVTLDDATLSLGGYDRETLKRSGISYYPF